MQEARALLQTKAFSPTACAASGTCILRSQYASQPLAHAHARLHVAKAALPSSPPTPPNGMACPQAHDGLTGGTRPPPHLGLEQPLLLGLHTAVLGQHLRLLLRHRLLSCLGLCARAVQEEEEE